MKTPIQELISKIDKQMSLSPFNEEEMTLSQRGLYDGYLNSKRYAESLLKWEKQIIVDTYNTKLTTLKSIYSKEGLEVTYQSGEQYFNQTFNNK